jgi:predicted metal-dependent phosphoesterase TrpH
VLLAFLLVLTAVALLPWNPQGPLDARDGSPLAGLRLSYPAWGALVEPFVAPGAVYAGAPDYRIALESLLAWLCGGAALLVALRTLRRRGGRSAWALLWRMPAAAAGAGAVLLVYVLVSVLYQFPGWRLAVDDPDALVADFHSHTLASHDGMVPARANLDWHAAHGYTLAAVTEHNDPAGSFAAQALAQGNPARWPPVIPGVEISAPRRAFLLGLGLHPDKPLLGYAGYEGDPAQYNRLFFENVHRDHEGATLALAWHLTPELVREIADAGVDGFEIANAAHPDVPEAVHALLLELARSRGLVLVATSDWHGWSGYARAWTVVRVPGLAALSRPERAQAVVRLLRERAAEAFVPVVAGRIGPPSRVRAVFAPFVEPVRYFAELSPLRVLAWWVWGALLLALGAGLAALGLSPGRIFLGAALAGMGTALIVRGGTLAAWWGDYGHMNDFAPEIGRIALGLGVVTALAGLALLARAVWSSRAAGPSSR